MTKQLQTVHTVVNALGEGDHAEGRRILREITGKSHQHVTNWLTIGRLPAWTYLLVAQALEERGFRVRPSVFGGEKRPLKIPKVSPIHSKAVS